METVEVELDLIRPSPYRPRVTFNLEDLKQEIQRDGLLTNLVVRKRGAHFELIDGERRWRALKELGWKTVPIRIVEIHDEKAHALRFFTLCSHFFLNVNKRTFRSSDAH